jgi:hypothetical protein
VHVELLLLGAGQTPAIAGEQKRTSKRQSSDLVDSSSRLTDWREAETLRIV